MLSVKKQHKRLLSRAFRSLEGSFEQVRTPYQAKQHKQLVITKLLQISDKHGLGLMVQEIGNNDRGEGVASSGSLENENTLPPPSNFPQCVRPQPLKITCDMPSMMMGSRTGKSEAPMDTVKFDQIWANFQSTTAAANFEAYKATLGDLRDYSTTPDKTPPEAKEPASTSSYEMPPDDPWPQEVEVLVQGYCPNPKLCMGAIVTEGKVGRKVSLWQGRYRMRVGSVLKCKLDLVQGNDARYMPV